MFTSPEPAIWMSALSVAAISVLPLPAICTLASRIATWPRSASPEPAIWISASPTLPLALMLPEPAMLTGLVEDATHTATPDTDLYSGGIVSLLVRQVHERHVTCDLHSSDAHRLGHTALAIAREFGGVALDGDGYRITAPEDLKPVPRQQGRASER